MTMDLKSLSSALGLDALPVGVYNAPDPSLFAPTVSLRRCVFDHYQDWQDGKTLVLSPKTMGCPGWSYWLLGSGRFPSREAMVSFLTDREGLRETREQMEAWLDANPTRKPEHEHILIGPVREALSAYLRTVTFFVTPDQLATLIYAAHYHARPGDPEPVLAPFGAGCGLLLNRLTDLAAPQAVLGATDIAMRSCLPPDRLAFTMTVPMLERMQHLDDGHSFLTKPFLRKMQSARVAGGSHQQPDQLGTV